MDKSEENQKIKDLEAVIAIENEAEQELSSYKPEPNRKPGEIFFAIFTIIFGALGYYFALGMTNESLSSPSVFPKLASTIIMICGGICLYKAYKKLPPAPDSPGIFQYLLPGDVIFVMAMLFIYCIALPYLHFIASSYIFMVVGMVYLHRGKYIWQSMLISAGAMAVLIAIFRYVFLVILP